MCALQPHDRQGLLARDVDRVALAVDQIRAAQSLLARAGSITTEARIRLANSHLDEALKHLKK